MINFPIVLFWIKFLSPSIDDGAIHGLTKQLEKINYSQLAGVANPKDASTWKGVNLTLQINQGNAKNLAQEDFDYAANAGANVIRLVINADPKKRNSSTFFDESGNILPQSTSPGIHDIKQAVEMARKANLKLILDMST